MNVDLRDAFLTGANLSNAQVDGAEFSGAHLRGVIFVPAPWNQAPLDIDKAHDIGWLQFKDNSPVVELLKKTYPRDSELHKQISAACRRTNETLWQKVLLDWTCEWGANPVRPLELLATIICLCTVIYWAALHFPSRNNGLYLQTSSKRRRIPVWRRGLIVREARSFALAFCFSVRSSINLGFGPFTPRDWVAILTSADYDIKATGWLRSVAGFQSIFGLAMGTLAAMSGLFDLFK
jgi:hypothetical protein